LVYDVTLPDTFTKVKKWVEELKAFNKNTVLALAGNKIDLKRSDIDKETILKYSQEENAEHFYTSAKTGEGLDEIFSHITKEILNSTQNQSKDISGGKSGNKKLVISKGNFNNEKKNSGCC
jgi:GTPase SAR1 family protein